MADEFTVSVRWKERAPGSHRWEERQAKVPLSRLNALGARRIARDRVRHPDAEIYIAPRVRPRGRWFSLSWQEHVDGEWRDREQRVLLSEEEQAAGPRAALMAGRGHPRSRRIRAASLGPVKGPATTTDRRAQERAATIARLRPRVVWDSPEWRARFERRHAERLQARTSRADAPEVVPPTDRSRREQ